MGDNKIFISCDASDKQTGAVLTYSSTRETACPVAFDSTQLCGAELNYPVHEKKLLAIVRALKKWQVDLLGEHFEVFTDHHTLENFTTQKDLSHRQAHWQEFLGQYDFNITCIPGEDNLAADALSRLPDDIEIIAALTHAPTQHLRVASDLAWLKGIQEGYKIDLWCQTLSPNTAGIRCSNGLWFVGERLIIPRITDLREGLFCLAHDARGHFGFDKSYTALRDSYYWPNMHCDLEKMYIPSCENCQ